MRTDGTVVATNINFPSDNSLLVDGVKIISRILLVSSLDQHIDNFGYPPKLVSSDRGVYSQSNENYAQSLGIKQVILPKGGYRSKERIQKERKINFIKGRHWHNGVEGRISFLKRCFGFQRCLYRGDMRLKCWVGWEIIAHNLTIISGVLIFQTKTVK